MNRKMDYKYQTYHINKSIFTGKLRDRLFEMVLTDDVHHREQLYEDFLAEIQQKWFQSFLAVVIKGRKNKRIDTAIIKGEGCS
jgi:L-rhamnose mutarotase